jgi:hypothetical protein
VRPDRAYRLVVRRGGIAPALIADPARLDRVEVLDIETSECVIFWDCPPRRAVKLARAVRHDLRALEAGPFISRWT